MNPCLEGVHEFLTYPSNSACLAARSDSLGEITGSLYTLIMTNIAMAVTAIIMGLEPNTGMSFHEYDDSR